MNSRVLKILFALLTLVTLATATVIDEPDSSSRDLTSIRTNFLETDVYTTPAVTFFGKFNGDILRCQQDQCEIFHQANDTKSIYSLHISGEYLYAGRYSFRLTSGDGDILKCHLYTKHSCKIFYSGYSGVWSLTSVRGHLLVGLDDLTNGTIMMCKKHQADCRSVHMLGPTVASLTQIGDNVYAGSVQLQVIRCSSTLNRCTQVHGISDKRQVTMGIAYMDNIMYLLEHTGVVRKCPGTLNTITNCIKVYLNTNGGYTWKMVAFNASVYVLGGMGVCDVNTGNCVSYTNQTEFRSMAMVYKTRHMQSQYKDEHRCRNTQCKGVTYYNEDERAAFEVHVKDGRLYNANDSLVDTSDADEGNSGPAAIFIMAPEGKIYLSNHHQGTHTSSFLAGNPVSGAGEMVVEKGVVKKITACSNHYKPDLELNKQVIQSLLTQGYTEPIVSEMCP